MSYQIKLSHKAQKDLKKLSPIYQKKVIDVLDGLPEDPFLGVKLQGQFVGFYKVKIPPMRVIYKPDVADKVIYVLRIGHRQGVYKG